MLYHYYIIEVVEDVEPVLHGPYNTEDQQDQKALDIRLHDPEMNNGIYPLKVSAGAKVKIDSYGGGFFDTDPSEYDHV